MRTLFIFFFFFTGKHEPLYFDGSIDDVPRMGLIQHWQASGADVCITHGLDFFHLVFLNNSIKSAETGIDLVNQQFRADPFADAVKSLKSMNITVTMLNVFAWQ